MVKRLRPTEDRYDDKETKFELVELGPEEYDRMIRQLHSDLKLCKKFREQKVQDVEVNGISN